MNNFSRPEVLDDAHDHQTTLPRENQPEQKGKTQSIAKGQPYTVALVPVNSILTANSEQISLNVFSTTQQSTDASIPTFVIYTPMTKKNGSPRFTGSDHFIKKFNNHRGNDKLFLKASKMIKANRILGGLESPPPGKQVLIDIPSARKNFALLATLDNLELKMAAMDNLLLLLENDDLKCNSAFDLVSLAIDIMNQMDRELIQTQLIDIQIKICKIYGAITELIIRHYGKKHVGGITKELKTQLINTARTLKDLNRQGNPLLYFTVEFALEGVKRLRDDRKELFELFEKIYCGFLVATSATAFYGDVDALSSNLHNAFSNLNLNLKSAWYDAALLFNGLAKEAFNDPVKLVLLQAYVCNLYSDVDWKFLYNTILKYAEITIKSTDMRVRKYIFEGHPQNTKKFPGLIQFVDISTFWRKPDFKPIVHFERPQIKDFNIILRELCVQKLIEIAQKSPEKRHRKRAKQVLIDRSKLEQVKTIKSIIIDFIPYDQKKIKSWLNETQEYAMISNNGNAPDAPTDNQSAETPQNSLQIEPVQKAVSKILALRDELEHRKTF